MQSRLSRAEAALATLLTLGAIWLNGIAAWSAGPLWRDEANTVALANLPTLGEVWVNLQFDSFPLLWLLVVRNCSAIFGISNDAAFRTIGFIVGGAVVVALWISARTLSRAFPLLSLVLLGLCPSMVLWGGSMRAYGFGVVLMLLSAALLWRFVERPAAGRFAFAAIAAIASVHALYYNAVFLLAFGVAAIAVCARHGRWITAAQVALIGAASAASLLPYAGVVGDAGKWSGLAQMPDYTFGWFMTMLYQTIRPGGFWVPMIWIQLVLIAMVAGLRATRSKGETGPSTWQKDVLIFALVSLAVGSAGFYLFLDVLSYYTSPWYYLSLLALAAVCIDAISGAVLRGSGARMARLAVVLVLGIATMLPATRAVAVRKSNVDVVAEQLRVRSTPGDAVFVNVWWNGVSFSRYYRGPAPWMTVPPIGSHQFHRFDLIRQLMSAPDQSMPVGPVIAAAAATLSRGDRVFVVGDLPFTRTTSPPRLLLPNSQRETGALASEYLDQWGALIGHYLRQHAIKVSVVAVSPRARVSNYEDLPLYMFEGWRP